MILTETLVSMLESIQLTEKTYLESYRELAEKLQETVKNNSELDEETKNYFYHIVNCMKVWSDVCDKLMNVKQLL